MTVLLHSTHLHVAGQEMPCTFGYDPADPHTVWIDFPPDEDEPDGFRWIFDRGLLADGLDHSAGEGDVQVRPMGNQLLIRLTGTDRVIGGIADAFGFIPPAITAVIHVPLDEVVAFLERTYVLHPPGAPMSDADLDTLISRLLEAP